jgi:signal transduction histidine kinase
VNDPRARWLPIGIVVGVAALSVLMPERIAEALDLWAISVGVCGALAAVAGVSYRDRRDPGLLLIATGAGAFAAIALVRLALRMVTDVSNPDAVTRWLSVAWYGPLLGTSALAGCLVFVRPWRDRRGRPPLRPGAVAAAVGFPLALLASWLIAAHPLRATGRSSPMAALAIAVAVAAVVAAIRLFGVGRWWYGASASALLVAALGWSVFELSDGGRVQQIAFAWAWTMPLAAAGLLLAGVQATIHLETGKMRRASDRAAAVMEGRAEIASMVAHDVRGPVTTIKGLASTTRNAYERLSDDERLEFVGMIEQESARLLDLVNQTALALKVDADTLVFDLREQELGPIVHMAVDAVDVGAHPLATDLDDRIEALLDVRWMTEAIRQGVENASKFSPPTAPIAVKLRSDAANAVIEIADEGPGIPPERHEEVFERFSSWRPDGYEDVPGSALGLFIARGIARAHGGNASLAERQGGGTILRIVIPKRRP